MLVAAQIEELPLVAHLVTMKQCSPMITKPDLIPMDVRVRLGGRFLRRSRVNHEDSVDIEHPVRVDHEANPKWKNGQRCWEAKGKCAQMYAEARIKLLKELDQSRQESFREICVSLFMVGKTPGKAKPMIIISSEDEQSRKGAKDAIIRSGVLTDYGFKIGVLKYLPSGPIHPAAGSPSEACWNSASESEGLGSDTWKEKMSNPSFHSNTPVSSSAYYDSKQGLRITGMPIYVKTADGRSRMGTANVVHNGSKYGYITAAHIFYPPHQSRSSIDDDEDDLGIPFDSDSDNEDGKDNLNEKASLARVLLSDSVRSRESHVFHADGFGLGEDTGPRDLPEDSIDLPHDLALLGRLESGQEPEKSLDCAIITIDDPGLQRKLDRARVLARNDGSHVSTSTAEPEPSLATAWTTHGPVHGNLNKVPVLMRLPGSMSFQSVYTFAYEGKIERGDCGSLVLDTTSRALYGMIIAAADRQPIAYIIAAKALMNHVANAGWHLLDANDDYMNSNEIHDEEPQAQSRLQPRLEHTSHEPLTPEPDRRSIDLDTPSVSKAESAYNNQEWTWSDEYQNYYYVQYDQYNRPVYYWRSQSQAYVQQAGSYAPDTRIRFDSAMEPQTPEPGMMEMPEPAPQDVRTLQGFISGTPQTGWYDRLDTSYRMRTGQEAREFFKVGKVFAMLYTEAASDTSVQHPNDEAYAVVRFGQSAHTNIRRFIVVDVRRGFVNACGIGTYPGRGTLKDGCNPAEHTIVYLSGTDPASCYIPGEYERGMIKEPIEVVPAETNERIRREDRIRFGKVYPIEMNVKVKDIGQVRDDQISALLSYWQQENYTTTLASTPSSSTAFSSSNWSSGRFSS